MQNYPILNNWALQTLNNPTNYAPEQIAGFLTGTVTGHLRHRDGSSILTSRIIGYTYNGDPDNFFAVITKSGTAYVLGTVNPDYEAAFPNAFKRLKKVLIEKMNDPL